MTINNFIESLKELNIILTEQQLEQLNKYYELLIEWNNKINLTGITEKNAVYLKHFYDSLTINKIVDLTKIDTLCDIGTGAGFPGIVLKIVFPDINITLVDSLNKRINFLNIVIKDLGLKKIKTVNARAEEYSLKNREKFDLVTARAVAPLPILLEYSIPLVTIGGIFVAMKADISEEIKNINNCLNLLNIEFKDKKEFLLPIERSKRTLVLFYKKSKTSMKFPRKYNEIKKKPL